MSLQHVVVIGGSSGIGLATATLLLKQGYRVTIAGRDGEKLAAVKASLDGNLRSLVLDATQLSTLGQAFAGIGAFDHLVLAMGSGHVALEEELHALRTSPSISDTELAECKRRKLRIKDEIQRLKSSVH